MTTAEPRPGQLRRLDEVCSVVLADNPGWMTLEGTNTYLLGQPGTGEVVLVDPGPALPAHRDALDAALDTLDARVVAVVLTHHHADHAEAAGWAGDWGATLHAFEPSRVPEAGGRAALQVADGQGLRRAGLSIEAVHTPGHCADHLCLRVRETDVVLSGDHVLGRGTTVVAWPDGDMGAYLDSLRRLQRMPAAALYPGHGPVVREPGRVVTAYLAHRLEREDQVLEALRAGDEDPGAVVRRVYADVDPALHPAAERSVRAHLDTLTEQGRVVAVDGRWSVR